MKLLKLRINNFLSFTDACIALDDKGLVAVQGKNLDGNGADSNGSGKSSLFIAIRWCLYGETDKSISADEVVNDKIGKNCMVETLWLDDATGICYRIGRYRKHSKHKNKLRLETLHPGVGWTDDTLGKNDLTQASVNAAIGMDDAVFMASCFASQEAAVDIPAMKDSELKTLLESSLPFAKIEPLHLKYKAKLDELNKSATALQVLYDRASHSHAININLLTETRAEERAFLANRDTMKQASLDKIKRLEEARAKLHSALPDVARLNALVTALQAKEASLGLDGASVLQMRLQGLFARQMDLDREDPSKCPTCGSDMEDSAAIWALMDKRSKIALEINTVGTELKKLKENAPLGEKIREKYVDLMGQINKAADDKMMIDKLGIAATAEHTNVDMLDNNPYVFNIKTLEGNVLKDSAAAEDAAKRLDALKPDIQVYANLVEATSPKGFRYHMLESVTKDLNRQTNYYLAMLTDGKITATWSTVKRLASGDFKEAFSIKVNMNGRSNFGSLSGGQKRKVRLACWFALQDLIADRAEKDVKLWVCDEVDGALDKAGIERLMSLLEEKARTKGTVLVISHNNLKDWIANGIVVSMEGDVSKVSGFLNVV
jgi:DNA repair exonuclease SbcCD ATPase subunit